LEIKLDLTAKEDLEGWSYKTDVQCDIMGDLQRMENGNHGHWLLDPRRVA